MLARYEGSEAGVAERTGAAMRRFGGRVIDAEESHAAWTRIRDVAVFHSGGGALWRLAIAPASLGTLAAALARDRRCRWFADWGGSLVWVSVDGEEGQPGARASAEDLGGSATLFRAMPGTTARIWPAAQPAVHALNARIRASFDPSGLFNPGRLDA